MTDSLFSIDDQDPGSPSATDGKKPFPAITTSSSRVQGHASPRSLYRKYRPQSFASDELFGQQHIVNTLKNAIRLDRIGHAYLFCGPRGTGKTTTARILAKAVNCLDSDPGNRPCNACNACMAINATSTTDVIEIDAASNRGIDDIRELRERVKFAPTMLNTKFYIIDEAHQITGAAANAFLKTLEEPPAHTRFVLATTDPEALLETIVSRCQRFDFRRISLDAMTACLAKVATEEEIEIDDDAITTISRHATGSLRDALGLLDQIAVYRDDEDANNARVTNEMVRLVLGISRNDRVEGLVRAIAEGNPGPGLTIVNDAIEAGEDARQLGRQLISYLRMLMLERASGSPDADDTARDLAQRFELGRLAEVARIFAEVEYKARHASIPQLPLELAIVRASLPGESPPRQGPGWQSPRTTATTSGRPPEDESAPPPRRSGPTLRDRVRGAPVAGGNTGSSLREVVETPPQTNAPIYDVDPDTDSRPDISGQIDFVADTASAGDADLNRIVELWDTIRMDVKALNRRTEALLQQADPLQVEGNHLTLVAAYPFHQKRLNDDDTRKIIEEVIERRSGTRMTVSSISRDEAREVRAQGARAAPAATAQPINHRLSGESASRQRDTAPTPAAKPGDDDESDPAHPDSKPEPGTILLDEPSANGTSKAIDRERAEQDEARIEAAINIFDAEIIHEDK